jgi:hypothetical protein
MRMTAIRFYLWLVAILLALALLALRIDKAMFPSRVELFKAPIVLTHTNNPH